MKKFLMKVNFFVQIWIKKKAWLVFFPFLLIFLTPQTKILFHEIDL
jgi:hypothetical protein